MYVRVICAEKSASKVALKGEKGTKYEIDIKLKGTKGTDTFLYVSVRSHWFLGRISPSTEIPSTTLSAPHFFRTPDFFKV